MRKSNDCFLPKDHKSEILRLLLIIHVAKETAESADAGC